MSGDGKNRELIRRWDGPRFTMNHTKKRPVIEITCPGATIWAVKTDNNGNLELYVSQGIEFKGYPNKNQGHNKIGEPVYAEGHIEYRAVYAQDLFQVGQCKACQLLSERSRRSAKRKMKNSSISHREGEIERISKVLKGRKITKETRAKLKQYLKELKGAS